MSAGYFAAPPICWLGRSTSSPTEENVMQRFFTTDAVTSLEDVRKRLADPIKHWRKGYSAFELADKWISADDFPQAVRQVMDAYPLFWGARLIEAFFERKVELETPGRPSQNDILVYAKLSSGFLAIAVEGKVREPFDKYIFEKEMTPGVETRILGLCNRLEISPDKVQRIRYQLLHRAVSAVLEAERYGAEHALMLVHSFCARNTSFEDYHDFATLLGFTENAVQINQVFGFKQLGNVKLHLGWVKDIPSTDDQAITQNSDSHEHLHPNLRYEGGTMTQSTSPNRIINQIKLAIRRTGAIQKSSSTVSSNISSGFKKETGGQDYKEFYGANMRSRIASLGANFGVETSLIVDFVVAARDLDPAAKDQMLDEIFSS
jgi:hypothetical protein